MSSLRDFSRCALVLSSACLTLTTGVALAEKPKAAAITQPSELMTFANVSVVNATPSTTKKETKPAPAMRAYSDGTQLVEPTAERAKELDASAAPKVNALGLTKKSAVTELAADETAVQVSPSGGTLMALGDDFAVYQVAHKKGDRVVIKEATGKSVADKLATEQSATAQAASEEVSNER